MFLLISNCIKCKWTRFSNQNMEFGRMHKKIHIIQSCTTCKSFTLFFYVIILSKRHFSLFSWRKEGGGRETSIWERNIEWLPPIRALIRDQSSNLSLFETMLQPTNPHWPGLQETHFKSKNIRFNGRLKWKNVKRYFMQVVTKKRDMEWNIIEP